MRQKARYTKLPRTSRSHSSKVQSWRCLRTSIRRTTAAGVPNRPRRRLCGWRWAKASATTIDEDIVIKNNVDLPECGIPELVGVRQEHFHEAALPVRSPHHGASGEATRPQGCTA